MGRMKDLATKMNEICHACNTPLKCEGCVMWVTLDNGRDVKVNGKTREIMEVHECSHEEDVKNHTCTKCGRGVS